MMPRITPINMIRAAGLVGFVSIVVLTSIGNYQLLIAPDGRAEWLRWFALIYPTCFSVGVITVLAVGWDLVLHTGAGVRMLLKKNGAQDDEMKHA